MGPSVERDMWRDAEDKAEALRSGARKTRMRGTPGLLCSSTAGGRRVGRALWQKQCVEGVFSLV